MNTRFEVQKPAVNRMNNPLDIKIKTMDGENTTLRALGKVGTEHWVVVNVASACGFTRQYAGLQTLSQQEAVTVVGFPCNKFGAQEPGIDHENRDFTARKFGVDFPLMKKIDLK